MHFVPFFFLPNFKTLTFEIPFTKHIQYREKIDKMQLFFYRFLHNFLVIRNFKIVNLAQRTPDNGPTGTRQPPHRSIYTRFRCSNRPLTRYNQCCTADQMARIVPWLIITTYHAVLLYFYFHQICIYIILLDVILTYLMYILCKSHLFNVCCYFKSLLSLILK